MIINVHAGHNPAGKVACGAVSLLNESTCARSIKNKLLTMLRKSGYTVYDCTCSNGTSQSDVLAKIVKKCNAHNATLDISIHLNSARNDLKGDGKTGGVEVLIRKDSGDKRCKLAKQICKNISEDLDMTNRGVKSNTRLYVLNKTKAPALLIECCFVDDKDDQLRYNATKIARAIADAVIQIYG